MDEEMKQLLSIMKSRFDKLDAEFAKFTNEFAEVKGAVRRTAIEVSRLKESVIDIRLEMATKHDIGRQDSRLRAFMTEIENSRKERILAETSYRRHEDRLDDHDKRLGKLEERRV